MGQLTINHGSHMRTMVLEYESQHLALSKITQPCRYTSTMVRINGIGWNVVLMPLTFGKSNHICHINPYKVVPSYVNDSMLGMCFFHFFRIPVNDSNNVEKNMVNTWESPHLMFDVFPSPLPSGKFNITMERSTIL